MTACKPLAKIDGHESGAEILRRPVTRLSISLPLIGVSCALAVGFVILESPIAAPGSLPVFLILTALTAALRIMWNRLDYDDHWRLRCFWANLALAAALIVCSPVFGLYLMISYYEASLVKGRAWKVAGIIGTALIISVAQTGGIRSPILTVPIYLAFVAINLAVAFLMAGLDRQREHLMRQLTAANEQLRTEQKRTSTLTEQLIDQARDAAVAEERKRLSREIHDTVAQDLVAIISQLAALSDDDDVTERHRRLSLIDATAHDALAEARRAVAALASPRLDDTDLALALDDLLGQWRETTGLDGELIVTGHPIATDHDDDLLRVTQEALANVAKHAQSRHVDVLLAYADEQVRLVVKDDGRGFDSGAITPGYGLGGLRTRMEKINGSITIESTPGQGTSVRAELPLLHRKENFA